MADVGRGRPLAVLAAPTAAQDNPVLAAYERSIVRGDEPDAAPRVKIVEFTSSIHAAAIATRTACFR